jgi:TM2 domain-containing membrane protein YozV
MEEAQTQQAPQVTQGTIKPQTLDTTAPYHPLLIAVAQWFGFACLGYFLLGQQRKAICSLIYAFIPIVGWIIALISVYDAYMIATKVQNREQVDINYCHVQFLSSLPLWKDTTLFAPSQPATA